ncbi:serine hydrolase domain-containing protein [Flavihumibacter stibioxidans]|uniref:Serine hydrolase n=1 Tax=Flavihumibacter stibioxidans TaxID=1834163 RepID=A0ABR7M8F9_9BACT|nr:serine hydrolase domain-containing protein [Flavihumibacter stibioxidans]MBC6491325.1 serine hydrolase [Flavihumibacter stibioxidans]
MVTRSIRQFAITGILTLCIFLPGYAQPEKAEAGINALMQQKQVVGLSVAVVKNNKVIYSQAFGLKDLESGTPLDKDHIFRIASISKSFSATSIMQLIEQEKLSLDDDMSKLVGFTIRNPAFPETVITLRHVLSHRSSINDSQGYFTLDAINPDKNPNWAKCYNTYEPGTGYMYCNLNYNMVGTIIEKTSGERFDQYVKHHVLDPLRLYGGYNVNLLDSSRFAAIYEYQVDSARFVFSPGAYASRKEEIDNYQMGYSTPIFSPTGGMKISAGDLAQYMIMHMKKGRHRGQRIMSKQSALLMQAPLPGKENYGLAISTTDKLIAGKTLKGHTGSAYGLYSAMFFHPKEKWGIVVISNGCHPGYTDGFNTVIRQTVELLYNSLIL